MKKLPEIGGEVDASTLLPGVVPDVPARMALPAIGEEISIPPAPAPRAPAPLPAIGEEVAAPAPASVLAAPEPEPDVDARLKSLFQLGLQINPTEQAGVNHLARELDLPPALVAQQYPLFQKAAEAVQFDPARFRRDNPGLVELLLDNPRSGLHPKQAEQLSGFTKALRALWKYSEEHPLLSASAIPLVPGTAAIAPALSAGELMDLEDATLGREATRESRTVKT